MNRHILFGRNQKINKQILSILLASAVLMSLSVPSYAYDAWTEDETDGDYSDSKTDEEKVYEEIWVDEVRWKQGKTVQVSIGNPIPQELLDMPESNVEGYEFDGDIINDDIFSGDKTVTSDDSMIVAEYDNGSVAILYDDGTYEGIGEKTMEDYINSVYGDGKEMDEELREKLENSASPWFKTPGGNAGEEDGEESEQ